MGKEWTKDPWTRARGKVEFLIAAFNSFGQDAEEPPDFGDWGYFSDGVVIVLQELAADLDNAFDNKHKKPGPDQEEAKEEDHG